MSGVIRTPQRCPVCGKKYPSSNGGYPITCCKTQPTKYTIRIPYQGKSQDVSYDSTGRTIHLFAHAVNLLGELRSKIQAGTLDLETYKKQSKTSFAASWNRFVGNY